MKNGISLERMDEELHIELTRPIDAEQRKQLVVKVTITRTLTFSSTAGARPPGLCQGESFRLIV